MGGKLTIGNVEIVALTDAEGPFPYKLGQVFPTVQPAQWEPFRQRYPKLFVDAETWHNHFGCYLVRSRGRTILVDTVIGPGPVEILGGLRGKLLDEMKAAGAGCGDVDTVFLTHLHIDHVGWNLVGGKPTFPKARYVFHQADWDAFQRADVQAAFPPYVDQAITPLKRAGFLDLGSGEESLTDEVVAIPTPGHTPGHMSILVSSGGQKALILADVAIHPAQITEESWNAAFDMNGETALATRKQILDRLEAEGLTMAACHFPEPGFGRIVRLEGRRYWQAL